MFTGEPSDYYFGRLSGKMPGRTTGARATGSVKPSAPIKNRLARADLNLDAVRNALAKMDIGGKANGSEHSNQVFKGSALVSALLYTSPRQFKCRATAFKFAKRLFRLGFIRSIFGWTTFEDSTHLYRWEDDNVPPRSSSRNAMMSYPHYPTLPKNTLVDGHRIVDTLDGKLIEDVKGRLQTRGDKSGGYIIDSFFRDLEKNFPEECQKPAQKTLPSYWQSKRASTTSTDSSADPYSLYKSRDRLYPKSAQSTPMASSREHSAIPEEATDTYTIGRLGMQMPPFEYEISNTPGTYNSHASSGAESLAMEQPNRRFADQNFSFSDNEKQLLEEMKRMKKEHQHILRSYEDRINKLMVKMHELRSIAEMLENSSTKSSPYGIIPGKSGVLGSLEGKLDPDRSWTGSNPNEPDVPPPLPPRPSRGNKVYPNKPILQPRRRMKYIPWKRIILSDLGTPGSQLSIWHTMVEPKVDADTVEEKFNDESESHRSPVSLYDDVLARRGRSRNQVTVIDRDKGQLFLSKIQFLKLTLQDVLLAITDLQTTFLDQEGSDSLLDLVLSHKDMERVAHQVKRNGLSQMDLADYILYEISRVDHYRAKAELLRFQQRIHDYIFDIDQQLKDVRTACEEICSSVYLKNLLETLLALGNLMNGGTANGQADGYHLEVLTKLKSTADKDGRESLLVYVLRLYCELHTQDISRFSLPEPSNMRHASQVSLVDVNNALDGLSDDLHHIKKNITPLLHPNSGTLSDKISERLQQFFATAEESIEGQRKHYRETKENFLRTAAYFMFDNENVELCTKTFFGVWATFLHDCKHYWKEVQRKLAKERFQTNFAISPAKTIPSLKLPLPDPPPDIPPKPSNSSSSLGKLTNSPSKTAGDQQQPESHSRKREKWETPEVASLAGTINRHRDFQHSQSGPGRHKATQDIKSPPTRQSSDRYQKDLSSNRSSSPKRFVSTPPTGDIHRPVPTPPKPSKPYSNNTPNINNGNYENQDASVLHKSTASHQKEHSPNRQGSNGPPSPRRAQIPVPEIEENQRKQSNGFSLKSWLRKESAKPRPGNPEQMVSPKEQDHQNKPNTAFVKLRNTVVQKFGSSNQTRRHNEASPETRHSSAVTESRGPRQQSPSKHSTGYRDSSSGRSRSRSPSGDRTQTKHSDQQDSDMEAEEEVAFYNGRVIKTRDRSPSKNTDNKTAAPALVSKPESNSNYQSFGMIDPATGKFKHSDQMKSASDLNNNQPDAQRQAPSKRGRGRDRAPLALGSNISLSDPYPRTDQNPKQTPQRQTWDNNSQQYSAAPKKHGQYNTIAGSSPGNPTQTYRATVIHMYENQSKYDAAEDPLRSGYLNNNQEGHFQNQPQKYNTVGQGRSNNYLLMQSKDENTGRQGAMKHDHSEEFYPSQRRQRKGDFSRVSPEKPMQSAGKSYQGMNYMQPPQLNPKDKAAAHAQSITSLIERFDAGKGPPPPGYQEAAAMTSTPVTQRKNMQMSLPSGTHSNNRYPQHNQTQNPFPLLDGVGQAISGGHQGQVEPNRSSVAGGELGRESRYSGEPMARPGHHSYPPQPSSHAAHYEQQRRPEHDEGYRDQLRRAFNNNNSSVKQRYPTYSGQSSTFQRSPPQMMRAFPVQQPGHQHGGVTV